VEVILNMSRGDSGWLKCHNLFRNLFEQGKKDVFTFKDIPTDMGHIQSIGVLRWLALSDFSPDKALQLRNFFVLVFGKDLGQRQCEWGALSLHLLSMAR
jgi:hypothetical protein